MARAKNKNKDKEEEEELALEKTGTQDAGGDEEEPESEDEGKKKRPKSKSITGLIKSIDKKGLIIGAVVFVFIGGAVFALFKSGLIDTSMGKKRSLPAIDLTGDNLKEESLSPFFIPPSSDLSRQAVRIDLTVIWDGLAAVRFKSNELRIRAEAYDYLKGFAEKATDLDSQKSAMEDGMSAIFRKSLGVNNLAIRIKELKII